MIHYKSDTALYNKTLILNKKCIHNMQLLTPRNLSTKCTQSHYCVKQSCVNCQKQSLRKKKL